MKAKFICPVAVAIVLTTSLHGQQPQQSSVTRHPGDVLHYQLTFQGIDVGKIRSASIRLRSAAPIPPNQSGFTNGFGGGCTKSATADTFDCAVTIPPNIADGDYRVITVSVNATPAGGYDYNQEFSVPGVPIQNPGTFTPPKLTVTEKP